MLKEIGLIANVHIYKIIGVVIACLVLFLANCSQHIVDQAGDGRNPDFSGFVTAIESGSTEVYPAIIVVESHADKIVNRIIVQIKRNTLVFIHDDSGEIPTSIKDIQNKDRVWIWFSGPLQEGFPGKATAEKISIIRKE